MNVPSLIILIAMGVTLAILLVGVFAMARGGEFNRKHSNRLMRLRVIAQFVTIMLILLFAFFMAGD